jgi:glutamine synthetase
LNTAVAEVLSQFADKLEGATDFNAAINDLIKETYSKHSRIVFNGNSYSDDWVKESEKRGLLNLRTASEALPYFKTEKNIELFKKHKVFTRAEVESRCELQLEGYIKILSIEAQTMLMMVKRDVLPASVAYLNELATCVVNKKAIDLEITSGYEKALVNKISVLCEYLYNNLLELETTLINSKDIADIEKQAEYFSNTVFEKMCMVRHTSDELETLVSSKHWPYPVYSDLLFSV